MLISYLLLAILSGPVLIKAQTGKIFPEINGVTLMDKKITVPQKNGKYSVIAIAFHKDAEEELKRWLNPLYESFMVKESKGGAFDMADAHDVNFIFIPMINGFKRFAEEFKKGTDKGFWPYIMDTEKTDIKNLQKQLGITDNKTPYFFVLDEKGKILASEKGRFDKKKMARLEDVIE
jgi:hypothetical protein